MVSRIKSGARSKLDVYKYTTGEDASKTAAMSITFEKLQQYNFNKRQEKKKDAEVQPNLTSLRK